MLTARIRGVSETRPDQRSARTPSSLLGESVTGAIQRFDSVELGIELTEFKANPLEVAVDGAVVDIEVGVMSGIPRSEESRVGTEGVSMVSARRVAVLLKNKK